MKPEPQRQRSHPPRVADWVAEFVPLNRRRLHGNPPLSVAELERWIELRDLLEHPDGPAPAHAPSGRPLRVPTHLKVRYEADGTAAASSHNISEGGLFVATRNPLAAGTPLRLEIDPEDGTGPIGVDATVVWSRERDDDAGPAGFGVRFSEVEADEFMAISRLIERALERMARERDGSL